MPLAAYTVLILFCFAGFFAIFFTTFGTFLIVLGVLAFAWMTEFALVDWPLIAIILVLYLVGEAMEYLLTMLGTRKWGGSRLAVLGAIVGGLIGAVLGVGFGGIGAFPGTLIGIFLGAFIVEMLRHGDWKRSLKAGAGGMFGRLASIFVKLIIAFLMFGLLAMKLWVTTG